MKRILWLWVLLILPSALLFAQDVAVVDRVVPNAGHYVVAIIAGFVLAVAFQLILSNLSIAAGLEVLSSVTKVKRGKNKKSNENSESSNTIGENIRMVSSAFGIWTLITATIALFFASWLATELSITGSETIGAVIGLVIWGLFYVAMMTIEVNALSSLVGSLIKFAATGLKNAYNSAISIFSRSEDKKTEDIALRVTKAVKEEIFGDIDAGDIQDQIQKYISQLKPQKIDPHQFAMEFAKILDNTEIQAITSHEGTMFDRDTIYASLRNSGYDEERAKTYSERTSEAINIIKEESKSGKSKADTAIDSAMRVTGMSKEEAENTRLKFENYLRKTGREELRPEAIKADLERLFSDPSGASISLRERFKNVDRESIANVISSESNMSKDEVNKRADQIFSVIQTLRSAPDAIANRVMSKMSNFFNSLDNEDLQYDSIAHDVERLFSDPKAGIDSLMRRLKSVDRDTLKKMLSYRKDISDEKAERIISKIENARDKVKDKVDQMQHEIERRLEDAKVEAVHQADEVRKTAATAAWWAFATAVISGIGAVMGGMIAA